MSVDAGARVARWSMLTIFFLNGFSTANWFTRIPAVVDNLGISEGPFGAALTGIALGSLLTMPVIGAAISRLGSRTTCWVAVFLLGVVYPLLALSPNLAVLFVVLVLFGVATGSLDVSMNSHGVAVETAYGRPLMSSFLASFSIGGFAGAVVGGFIAGQGVGVVPHFVGLMLLMWVVGALACRNILPASVDASQGGRLFARPTWTLLTIATIVFCVFVAEGAAGDWSAIYLEDTLGTGAGFAAYGFAAYTLMQTIGRVLGDRLIMGIGAVWLVRIGAAIAAVGLGVSLLIATPLFGLVGFGAVGFGMAFAVPAALSAAGQSEETGPAGPALAAVGVGQYTGAFIGAPLIGVTAEGVGLGGSLFIVVALCAAVIPLSRVLGVSRHAGAEPAPARSGSRVR